MMKMKFTIDNVSYGLVNIICHLDEKVGLCCMFYFQSNSSLLLPLHVLNILYCNQHGGGGGWGGDNTIRGKLNIQTF